MALPDIMDDIKLDKAKTEGFYTVEGLEAILKNASNDVAAHSLHSAAIRGPNPPDSASSIRATGGIRHLPRLTWRAWDSPR
jgi:hypothetical protein